MFGRRYIAHLEAECERLTARIAALEAQIDNLHSQGLRVATVVEEKPLAEELPPLPAAIQTALDGFDDEDARAEYASFARGRLAEGATADEVVTALLAGG